LDVWSPKLVASEANSVYRKISEDVTAQEVPFVSGTENRELLDGEKHRIGRQLTPASLLEATSRHRYGSRPEAARAS
jgi:hypothetical protein